MKAMSKKLKVGISIGVVLILVVACVLFINKGKDNSDNSKEEKVDVTVLAQSNTELLSKADYDRFKETNKNTNDLDKFIDSFTNLISDAGSYIENVDNVKSANCGESIIIKSFMKYQSKGICITYEYQNLELRTIKALECTVPSENDIYNEEYICIGEQGLDGIITKPNNVEKSPIVIMVQGSGSVDMDSTIGSAKLFVDLARELAEDGVTTIRFHKRFYQYQEILEKEVNDITIREEYLEDVSEAIKYAEDIGKDTDDSIYVLGHSMGGMITPQIVSENPSVDGALLLASSPRKLEDIILDQNIEVIKKQNLNFQDYTKVVSDVNNLVTKVKNLQIADGEIVLGGSKKYWESLNVINQVDLAKASEKPMLFLQGEADLQVNVQKDFEYWKTLLQGKENCTFISYPELNHVFMKSNGARDIAENNIKQNIDEQVIVDIQTWINSNK